MDESRRHSRWPTFAAAVVMLPVLYVLSIGPIIGIDARWRLSDGTRTVVSKIYAPLEWCYHNSDPAHAFFDWYFSLWR